jgi:ribonucleotide monophosphatase NagD (HAD superfamily)
MGGERAFKQSMGQAGGKMDITVSALKKTWLLDLDGTLVRHNGYLLGGDELLDGAAEFLAGIAGDVIVILTARGEEHRGETAAFLDRHGIRYDHIVFGLPVGERILINDRKPSGMATALAVNKDRDAPVRCAVTVDPAL